jgi:DNA invertase Pin-like site-specific DNA recombinase
MSAPPAGRQRLLSVRVGRVEGRDDLVVVAARTLDGLAAARARGRTGGQKPKLTLRQARIARQMYEEVGPDGRRVHTVEQIAAEFGVTRPTIYRHLAKLPVDAG